MTFRDAAARHPVEMFLAVVFLISWGGGAAFQVHALVLFPILILSVAATGIVLTRSIDGADGLRRLWARQKTWRVGRWYGLVLLPPVLILSALVFLRAVAGASFTPNLFLIGFAFGVPAGLFEEIGWTGYLFPRMAGRMPLGRASVALGILWGLWHAPVIDALGAATPHHGSLPAFALAFIGVVSALRVIISWAVTRTGSLLIAQLIHISSTGSLVMFGPPRVTPAQEALWYGAYAIALWIVAGLLLIRGAAARS